MNKQSFHRNTAQLLNRMKCVFCYWAMDTKTYCVLFNRKSAAQQGGWSVTITVQKNASKQIHTQVDSFLHRLSGRI